MKEYGNIKKALRLDNKYGYEINDAMLGYTTQKEAQEVIKQINKKTEWHVETYQKKYAELKESRNQKN